MPRRTERGWEVRVVLRVGVEQGQGGTEGGGCWLWICRKVQVGGRGKLEQVERWIRRRDVLKALGTAELRAAWSR